MKIKKVIIGLTLILFSCSSSFDDSFSDDSWINNASYNSQTETLIIEMNNKDYSFKGVPYEVWEGFKNASSKVSYYHQNIRGRYQDLKYWICYI
ncbi:MAG: KTSC domain-containing protein [Crocinitomicaceae bacterium]